MNVIRSIRARRPRLKVSPARRLAAAALACLGAFAGALVGLGGCAGPQGPDVVLIVIDTLRADHLGAYGAGSGRTPVLDRLAMESVVFERCYSQYPLTLPSISTLLASQWPHVHGVRENYDQRLSDDAETLTEVLAARGYETGAFVSALPVRAETGCAQGFDRYDDDFSDRYVFYQERMKPLEERWTGSERRGDLTIERAIDWVTGRRSPYFLYVHLFDPHSPYDAPEPYASQQPTPYAAEVAYADALVGRLLEAVRAEDASPIVAVVSDHGEGLGEHGEWAHGIFLYDTTLHVPWILSHPDSLAPARVTSDVRLLDVAPTLLALAGIPAPERWDGASALGLARGAPEPPREIYAENYFTRSEYGWSELEAWITPEWKWIRAPRPELYDRAGDPGELHNLVGARPAEAGALDDALTAFASASVARAERLGTMGLVETIAPEERVLDWLRSLGYLSGDDVTRPAPGTLPDPKDRIDEWNARNDANTHSGRGEALLDAGQPAVAVQAFETALSYHVSAEALTGLGRAQLELGASVAAESTLARAVTLSPRDVPALLAFARALEANEHLAEADSILTRTTLVDTTEARAFRMRARLRERRGNPVEAARDYERVLTLTPDDVDSRQRLADLYRVSGDWDSARPHLVVIAGERPWDPVAHLHLAEAQRRAGEVRAARRTLELAREHAGPGAVRDSIDALRARLD